MKAYSLTKRITGAIAAVWAIVQIVRSILGIVASVTNLHRLIPSIVGIIMGVIMLVGGLLCVFVLSEESVKSDLYASVPFVIAWILALLCGADLTGAYCLILALALPIWHNWILRNHPTVITEQATSVSETPTSASTEHTTDTHDDSTSQSQE
jgi:hypothetical protein